MNDWIGLKGYWLADNEYCEIVGVIDEFRGLYEFESLEEESITDGRTAVWIGCIDEFSPEC
ncbi:hypothetical protein [Micromonospora sp. CB01531]|uniref:hypothetical protein n=1 Tax=Micromonospora sp. CB01531 TaxID=1718947 RepID=UPI00093F2098|nr:hypothetical protein [Micromonospora sp. CB01531]OKI54552.1 hypothetical protein A6A27_32005 [Micromonospora sp. CB01531]